MRRNACVALWLAIAIAWSAPAAQADPVIVAPPPGQDPTCADPRLAEALPTCQSVPTQSRANRPARPQPSPGSPDYCEGDPHLDPNLPGCAPPAPVSPGGPNAPPQPLPPAGVPIDPSTQTPQRHVAQSADPLRSLGADSPMCKDTHDFDAAVQQSCKLSGSIARPYPVANYGLDVQVEFDVLHLWDSLMGIVQNVAAVVWLAFVHGINAMLLLLEWAFSLDILGKDGVMSKLHEGMTVLHKRVLGESWTLAALTALGLWGLWWGLVRGKTIESITGLGASVAMMLLALLIIYRPDASVIPVSYWANQGSKSVFSGIANGSIENSNRGFGDAEQGLFNSLVLRPWCALQFGDVEYCLEQRAGADGQVRQKTPDELSVADMWLEYAPGTPQRTANYQKTLSGHVDEAPKIEDCPVRPGSPIANGNTFDEFKAVVEEATRMGESGAFQRRPGESTNDAYERQMLEACEHLKANPRLLQGNAAQLWRASDRVALQEADGTFSRVALMVLILIGLVGALLLFFYLAIRLMLAAVFTLLLLLMAPVMLLVAALGNAGRQTFIAWFRRLISQVVAKFVYAIFLALIVLEANILSSL
jgi:hypothetical protein